MFAWIYFFIYFVNFPAGLIIKVCLLAYLKPTNEPKLSYFFATSPLISANIGNGKEYLSEKSL